MFNPLNRRDFLKMIGAGAAASACLPLLESVGMAADGQFPTRLIVFFSANGTIPNRWRPEGDENNWAFKAGDILEPLTPYKDDLLLVEGVDMISARNGPGDGHQTGMGHMLTGIELLPGDTKGGCDTCPAAGFSSGPSVDQFIADKIHNGEPFKSLDFAIQAGGPNNWSRMSYAGPNRPIDPQQNPHTAYERIFSTIGDDKVKLERIRKRRQSVLDFTREEMRQIERKVSGADRIRLEQHHTAIRELEQSLLTGDAQGMACEVPEKGQPFDANKSENFPAAGKAMMDMIVTSMACGMTRVATLQWSRSVSNIAHPWATVTDRHHDLSHKGDNDAPAVDGLVKINRWYAQQFGYLLNKLKSIPEGNGTMLDNTVVIWCNELGKGNSHTRNDVPYVLAGKAGGYFKTGRYLTYNNDPHNNMLVSLCQAMGVQVNTFGNPNYCTGPLARLHV